MEKLKHFSHEQHPLVLKKWESRDDEIVLEKSSLCHGCKTPITPSEPFYSCEENCTAFFLHKTCAQLPTFNFRHPMHPQHLLTLHEKPPYDGGECKCHCCGRKSWRNFTYHCETCNFDLDILCAALQGRKLEHPSHRHPLIPLSKRVALECHACGETKEDASYICSSNCSYWIHEMCALLPDTKKRNDHSHPLSLAYSVSDDYIASKLPCDVCSKRLKPYHWIYHCSQLCRYAVHLKCVESDKEYERRDGIRKGSLILHTDDFAGDLLETSDFRDYHMAEPLRIIKNETSDLTDFVQRCLTFHGNEIHGHSMIYFDVREDSNTRDKEIRCEACTDPIISICCKRVNHSTNYFLHAICALQKGTNSLFVRFDGYSRDSSLSLRLPTNTWDFFKCNICKLECNGYFYNTRDSYIDVKCALLPSSLNHEAHSHELVDRSRQMHRYMSTNCKGCGDCVNFYYECKTECRNNHLGYDHLGYERYFLPQTNYHLGYECALLPKTVRHRWDKHSLILSFPPYSDHPERFYCEVCEEEINPLYWQYRCGECDQSFHPRCIPQASSSRNIKFGITVDVDIHSHTLTLVQEVGGFGSTCQTCQKQLYERRAFECARCKFYVCHDCLVKIKTSAC